MTEEEIEFHYVDGWNLTKGNIPENVTTLYIENNPVLNPHAIPPSVKRIVFGDQFSKRRIQRLTFPRHLEELAFGDRFNKQISIQSGLFPPTVRKLTLSCQFFGGNYAEIRFNHQLFQNLNQITELTINCSCSQGKCRADSVRLENLPPKLERLFLPKRFYRTRSKVRIPAQGGWPQSLMMISVNQNICSGVDHEWFREQFEYLEDEALFQWRKDRGQHQMRFWTAAGPRLKPPANYKYPPRMIVLPVLVQKYSFGDHQMSFHSESSQNHATKQMHSKQIFRRRSRAQIALPPVFSLYEQLRQKGFSEEQIGQLLTYDQCIVCCDESGCRGYPMTSCCRKTICFQCYDELRKGRFTCPNCRRNLNMTS